MKKFLLLLFLLLATSAVAQWTPTPPTGFGQIYSQSYQLTGGCTGGDMVYTWSINGAPGGGGAIPPPTQYGASFVYPWTTADITMRGAELVVIPPAPGATGQPGWPPVTPGAWGNGPYLPAFTFLMIGNNAWGDAVLFMAANELHARVMFPGDTGMPFPGTVNETPMTYLDLHGSCTAGYNANVMLTIYYTIP